MTVQEPALRPSGDRFRVGGHLTIRGRSVPLTLDSTLTFVGKDPWGHQRAGFSATTEIHPVCSPSDHSYLSAIAGSICVARRAGTNAAAVATAIRTPATAANAIGSLAFTPKSRLARRRVKP